MDYHRALPPLADHPVLELRRPANKDACFAVSALSPNLSKRFGGDWDALSGRTSLLDRYLGQQALSSVVQEVPKPLREQTPPSPVTPSPVTPSPITPSLANVPASSKARWALMSQSVSWSMFGSSKSNHHWNPQKPSNDKVTPAARHKAADRASDEASQKVVSDRALQAASAAQRRRRERGPPPPSVTRSSTRLRDPQSQRMPPPATSSTRSREDYERKASPPIVSKFSPPQESIRGRTPPPPPSVLSSTQSREAFGGRASPPAIPPPAKPRDDRGGKTMVHRLEGFPIPRALSIIQDNPAPFDEMDDTVSLASGLEQLGRESSFSRVDSWIRPSLIENIMSTRGRDAPRYPGLPPAPNAKLKTFVPKIKTVRFVDIDSSGASSLMSPTFPDNDRNQPSPSPTTFSPMTPVAMTFEYPAIFENTPPIEQVPWDNELNELNVTESSPQDSILSVMTPKAIIESPARGRLSARGDEVQLPRPRARSHSPPRTPFPGEESTLQPLPTTIYTPIDQVHSSKQAVKDDFDLTYDVSEPIKDGVRLLDRTAIWVLSGKMKDTTEKRQMVFLGEVGNDREAILKSYFNRY
ncbi:hypothetical protein E2P81_ATG01543 [Venturia nashicola]|nr:hypothetical protein E2P81_ATG01543 [Venturia nashicola]